MKTKMTKIDVKTLYSGKYKIIRGGVEIKQGFDKSKVSEIK
jgi:hypothetical protein